MEGCTQLDGLVCDLCDATLVGTAVVHSCRPCNFDACAACFADPEGRQVTRMAQRLRSYAEQAQLFSDRGRRAQALQVLPSRLVAAEVRGAAHVQELLHWFKGEFFRWTDKPRCSACGAPAAEKEGMVEPLEEELRYGAKRVEAWRCTTCDVVARFPRYNDPAKLLETRHGRCGEWANCFTLLLAALGYDCRLAVDWTDHVWSEVRLGDRWTHTDPCEGCLDAPLTYEAGWGKKLTYIVAFSSIEVVDVTPRYTANWEQVLSRRWRLKEATFANLVAEVDEGSRRNQFGATVSSWRNDEERELMARRADGSAGEIPGAEELRGRASGSAEWRLERGELGTVLPLVLQEAPHALLLEAGGCGGSPGFRSPAAEASPWVARLLGGAALGSLDGVPCLDFTCDGAAAELADASLNAVEDAFLSAAGFTAEAWVHVEASALNEVSYRNPIISRHGPATGWELRLRKEGGAVFLVTVDGVHWEIAGPPGPPSGWCAGWTHIAGSVEGAVARLFVGGCLVAELALPEAGQRSGFDGPLLLGRNPAWRDRGARCYIAAARVAQAAFTTEAFLDEPGKVVA